MSNNEVPRKSGYDPATQVCWDFRNKGDQHWRCKCPAHTAPNYELFFFGRRRSGKRWFWQTHRLWFEEGQQPKMKFGWADSEELATAAAVLAVLELKEPGSLVKARFSQDTASGRLKEVNEEKRRQRPAPDTSGAHPVEYLYGIYHHAGGEYVNDREWRGILAFPIVKKTKHRIFYKRRWIWFWPQLDEERAHLQSAPLHYENKVRFVDRAKLEATGEIGTNHRWHEDWHLYLNPPYSWASRRADEDPDEEKPDIPTLLRLKAEMAAAHPDKGGTSAAFIAARKAYVEARRRARAVP
jgi:hypothetical protein